MRISDWSSDVCSSDLLDTLSPGALADSLDLWLAPLLIDRRGLRDITDRRLADALAGLLDWPARQLPEKRAPADYATPAGSLHPIAHRAEGAPTVRVPVRRSEQRRVWKECVRTCRSRGAPLPSNKKQK